MLLIRHGPTQAVREAAFGDDEGLETTAHARARELGPSLPSRCVAVCGPERACRETADALGLDATVAPALAACDVGKWTGRRLDDVAASDPAGLATWMSDPNAAPHGGESLAVFSDRIIDWLETATITGDGFFVAVVDAGAVKASVVHALGAPANGFWRVDVSPLTVTELHGHQGRWTLIRCNAPLARTAGVRYGP